jgi:hypothetical protein
VRPSHKLSADDREERADRTELGREIATAEDARRILKIGTGYNTVEERLFHLGLPPNRPEGQKGFLVYDTQGRVPKAAAPGASDPKQIL